MANMAFRNNRYSDALNHYENIIDSVPEFVRSEQMIDVAYCYEMTMQKEKAREVYIKLLDFHTNDFIVLENYANFCVFYGDYENALSLYDKLYNLYIEVGYSDDADTIKKLMFDLSHRQRD